MELDYRNMTQLIDIRMKQLDDVSKTHEYFNKEYVELMKIRKSLSNLLILERKTWQDFDVFEDSFNEAFNPELDETECLS